MIKAKCPLQIEGENFEMVVNVGTMLSAERKTGKGFMDLVKEAEKGSLNEIVGLLSSCLLKEGKPVGEEFIKDMDFEVFQELFEPLINTIIVAFPAKKDGKKKVVVLETIK